MGLFNKSPDTFEKQTISQLIFQVQSSYKMMFDGCGIEVFTRCKNEVIKKMAILRDYEKKYPKYFNKPTPSENYFKICSEIPECERKFVDYTIDQLEKKLLKYSTEKGKTNNFNKEVDTFHYFAGEFLPETVLYFDKQINDMFPQYIKE